MGKTYKDSRDHRPNPRFEMPAFVKRKTAVVKCVTGKVGFPSELRAQERAGEILSSGKTRGGVEFFRVYNCPYCKHWHLTSK